MSDLSARYGFACEPSSPSEQVDAKDTPRRPASAESVFEKRMKENADRIRAESPLRFRARQCLLGGSGLLSRMAAALRA